MYFVAWLLYWDSFYKINLACAYCIHCFVFL